MKWITPFIFLFFFTTSSLFGDPNPYFVATQPKGGTHLLIKILQMIDEEKPAKLFPQYDPRRFSPVMLDVYLDGGGLPMLHLFSPFFTYRYLLTHHLDSKVIMIIRDIRDAFVSYAYWIHKNLDIPVEEKISRVFEKKAFCIMSNNLSLFLNNSRFYIVRFEDLVGPMGGGDKDAQTETIYQLADYIGMPISEELAEFYGTLLFGNQAHTPYSGTFRQGKIGSWKDHFTEEHKRLFKERFGDELIRLGYEKDTNW